MPPRWLKAVQVYTSLRLGGSLTHPGQIELTNSSSSSFCIHQSTVLKESLDSQTLRAMGNSAVQIGARLERGQIGTKWPSQEILGSFQCQMLNLIDMHIRVFDKTYNPFLNPNSTLNIYK